MKLDRYLCRPCRKSFFVSARKGVLCCPFCSRADGPVLTTANLNMRRAA